MSDKQTKTLEDFKDKVTEELRNESIEKYGIELHNIIQESNTPDEEIIHELYIYNEAKDRFHAYQLEFKDKEIEELNKEVEQLKEKCSSEYWRGWNAYGESL